MSQHVDTLRKLATIFQHCNEAADALEAVGSVKQHIKELEVQRDKLLKQNKAEQEKAKGLFANLENVNHEISIVSAKADAEAESIVKQAKAQAKDIVDKANEKAAAVLAADVDEKKSGLANIKVQTTKAAKALKDKEEQLANIDSLVSAKQISLDTISNQLDEMKAKVQALING